MRVCLCRQNNYKETDGGMRTHTHTQSSQMVTDLAYILAFAALIPLLQFSSHHLLSSSNIDVYSLFFF